MHKVPHLLFFFNMLRKLLTVTYVHTYGCPKVRRRVLECAIIRTQRRREGMREKLSQDSTFFKSPHHEWRCWLISGFSSSSSSSSRKRSPMDGDAAQQEEVAGSVGSGSGTTTTTTTSSSTSRKLHVMQWGYLPASSPDRLPLLLPTLAPLPLLGQGWKAICSGGCGFALAISGKFSVLWLSLWINSRISQGIVLCWYIVSRNGC